MGYKKKKKKKEWIEEKKVTERTREEQGEEKSDDWIEILFKAGGLETRCDGLMDSEGDGEVQDTGESKVIEQREANPVDYVTYRCWTILLLVAPASVSGGCT